MTSYDFKLSMPFLSSRASVGEFLNQMKRNRCRTIKTRRIFAFTRALCLGETLVLLDVVSQHMAYIVT